VINDCVWYNYVIYPTLNTLKTEKQKVAYMAKLEEAGVLTAFKDNLKNNKSYSEICK